MSESTIPDRRRYTRDTGRPRGFAAIDPARQREIARLGGQRAHEKGTAHQWTSDEAKEAGRKGGHASRGGRGKAPEGQD